MKWIHVKDLLPPLREKVIIFWKGDFISIGYRCYETVDPADGWCCVDDDDRIKWTYWWMPLPKEPEE